jgi:hypothetical protein
MERGEMDRLEGISLKEDFWEIYVYFEFE